MILKSIKRVFFTKGLVALWIYTAFFSFAGLANALDIVLEPSNASRKIGDEVRVQIYADPATDLISMGVKVTYDPAILQVVSAAKYEDFDYGWIMDADGDSGTTGDQYTSPAVEMSPPPPATPDSVTLIGGHLTGSATTGLSGKVLLGWIVFKTLKDGTSNLSIDLARYNTPPETFDNFVQLGGTVSEPTNLPDDLGVICVYDDACRSDINNDGFVDIVDFGIMKSNFLTNCSSPPPGADCLGDLDGNGYIDIADFGILKAEFLRPGCLICN